MATPEEIEQLKRILTGQACPASIGIYGNRLCGKPSSNRNIGPMSISAFCDYHLDKIKAWAGGRIDFANAEKTRIIAEHEAEKAAQLEADSVVYFLRIPGDRVKIGTTGRLSTRLATHRKTFGSAELLLTIAGRRETERTMHERFVAYLVEGEREIFHAAPELLDWIDEQADKQDERAA